MASCVCASLQTGFDHRGARNGARAATERLRATLPRYVGQSSAVVDVDVDRQDVADAARALVADEGAGAGAPKAVGAGGAVGLLLGGRGHDHLIGGNQGRRIADRGQLGTHDRLDGRRAGPEGQKRNGGGEDRGGTHQDCSLYRAESCWVEARAAGPAAA